MTREARNKMPARIPAPHGAWRAEIDRLRGANDLLRAEAAERHAAALRSYQEGVGRRFGRDVDGFPDFATIARHTIEELPRKRMTAEVLASELAIAYEAGFEHGRASNRHGQRDHEVKRSRFDRRRSCPRCGKLIELRKDGTFRVHGPRNDRCPVATAKPASPPIGEGSES